MKNTGEGESVAVMDGNPLRSTGFAGALALGRGILYGLLGMRPHQWVKNLLIFVPSLAAHRFHEPDLWWLLVLASLLFSTGASGQYLLNDVFDLASDRAHPDKKRRPLAAGAMSASKVRLLALVLIGFSIVASYSLLPRPFLVVLVLYHLLGTTYSVCLRQIALLDVAVLVIMYILRLFAGAAVARIELSPWLLCFSVTFFLSLALLKRISEIACQVRHSWPEARPGYASSARLSILVSGLSFGGMAVLILVFYLRSEQVLLAYRMPEYLWLLCPLLAFWLGRFWVLADKGRAGVDPVSFVLRDAASYAVFSCSLLAFWAAL